MKKSSFQLRFANLVCGFTTLCCIAGLLFTIWNAGNHSSLFVVIFIAIFGTGLFIYLYSFKMLLTNRVNLALVTLAVAFTVLSTEIYLTVAFHSEWTGHYRLEQHVKKLNPLTKFEMVMALREDGVDAVPWITPHGIPFSKRVLGGISNKKVVFCNETGSWATYVSDEYGFNNPLGLYNKDIDVMLVGDSFAEGACVEQDYTISSRLRELGWSAVNLGKSGTGPLSHLGTISEYASVFKPKIVLWLYFEGNDLKDLLSERDEPNLYNYLEHGYTQNLILFQDEIDHHATKFIEDKIKIQKELESPRPEGTQRHRVWDTIPHRIELVLGVLKLHQIRRPFMPSYLDSSTDSLRDILLEGKKKVDEWGGQLYFVYLPQWSRYRWVIGGDENTSKRQEVLRIVSDLDINLIDFHQIIRQQEHPVSLFPFGMAGHYNQKGYQLLAHQISKHLRAESLPIVQKK